MLAALCFAMVFALCLTSYMDLCFTSLKTSTRFVMNMHCTELAESGIEQALYSQNNNVWSSWTCSGAIAQQTFTTTPLSYTGAATAVENGETWEIKVQVTNYGTTNSTIQSWGIVSRPDGTTVQRELTTTTSIAPVFVNAVAGISGRVRFRTSGSSLVDSYSSNPYVAPGTNPLTNYSAVVQSGYTSTGGVTLAAGTVVQGYAVGTSANAVSYNASSKIQSSPTGPAIDLTRKIVNPNPYQPELTEVPLVGGTLTTIALNNQTKTLGFAGATTPSIYYTNSNVTLTGTSTLTIAGPVILYIKGGNLSVGAGSVININSTTSPVSSPDVSLEIHLTSGAMSLGGNGINNASGEARRCVIMGSNNFSTQTLSSSLFCGVIYFPNATLDVNAANPIIYGSLVANAVSFTGLPIIHYDMALRTPDSVIGHSAFNCFENTAASGAMQTVAASSILETVPASQPTF